MISKKSIAILGIILSSSLILSGCGQKIAELGAEKAAERALENSLGGKANVDINGKTMEINTENGSIKSGENISLPGEFPGDVYIIDGRVITYVDNMPGQKYAVSIVTTKSIADAGNIYETKLKEAGWKITASMRAEGTVVLGAKKDDRNLSIIIGASDKGESMVTLGETK